MATNRLIMIMSTIPDSVKLPSVNPRFYDGIFNTDRTKRQIDGYVVDENENVIPPKVLCHAENYLLHLCRGEVDPALAVQKILDSSYELKTSEWRAVKKDPLSEWYVEPEVFI